MKNIIIFKVTALFFLTLIMGSSIKVSAQFDPMFTQYTNNEMFINPAYTGSKEALSITALNRQQWVGVQGRPITTTLTVHSPVWDDKMGLGVSLLDEKIGVSKRQIMYLSYSYKIKTGAKSSLGFGLMGGVHVQSNNFLSLNTVESGDPHFSNNIYEKATPNFGFGINYVTDKFFAGISIPRLLNDNLTVSENGTVSSDNNIKTELLHYYITAGRVFTINKNLKLKPTIMARVLANSPLGLDISLNSLIKEHLWVGVSYRNSSDISGMFGLQINPNFLISYSYDYPTTSINKFTGGSHEIVLSALIGYKGKKVVSNRYF